MGLNDTEKYFFYFMMLKKFIYDKEVKGKKDNVNHILF